MARPSLMAYLGVAGPVAPGSARAGRDLVLLDVQMPEMDGYEATRRIRETLPGDRQPRIIAMTAHAGEDARAEAKAKGMDDYVAKPVDIDSLVEALNKASDDQRPGA